MATITVEQASHRLGELVNAALAGENVILDQGARGAVRLVPVEASPGRPQFGSARGEVRMADDFDAPLEDFREYTRDPE